MNAQNNIEKAREADRLVSTLLSDGETTREEREAIFSWLDVEGNRKLLREALDRYYSSRSEEDYLNLYDHRPELVEKGWMEIADRLALDSGEVSPVRVARLQRRRLRRLAIRAAAVLVPAMLAVGGYFEYERLRDGRAQTAAAAFVATHRMAPSVDSVRRIILGDGTRVTLNRNSTFTYNDNCEGELHGEAYFEVAKNPEQPFVIYSEHVTAKVLGTEFNFDTNSGGGSSKLSLYDGMVELDLQTGTLKLNAAGKEFTLDHASGVADIHDFDPSQKPEWIAAEENAFNFISFGQIFDLVEEAYGVKVSGREAIDLNKQLNFVLDREIPIGDVMSMLEFSHGGFSYIIEGNDVLLKSL
jgi:hypothetical protein